MPELSEQSARECYDGARSFYKGGVKSTNKMYEGPVNQAKADSRFEKIMVGLQVVTGPDGRPYPLYPDMRAYVTQHGWTDPRLGYEIRMTERTLNPLTNTFIPNTRGNCYEMACVAASCVAEHIQTAPLHFVRLPDPGDHAFVIVGPLQKESFKTIQQLKSSPKDNNSSINRAARPRHS